MEHKDEHILVFDSGLGGISVLRELVRVLPRERYLYLGDSENAPYGSKSTARVRELTMRAVENQLPKGIKAVVIACNTATAAAIEDLRQQYPDKVIIGVEPALKPAADHYPGGQILVMATEVTLREEKFANLMERFSRSCGITPLPCPGLVEFVESGELDSPRLEKHLRKLLGEHLTQPPRAVVLGCTHFPFLRPVLRRLWGDRVDIMDGAQGTAIHTRRRLEEEGLLRESGEGSVTLMNSRGSDELIELSKKLLGEPFS